jgi:tetratricopeptide (TPR) repeat protein
MAQCGLSDRDGPFVLLKEKDGMKRTIMIIGLFILVCGALSSCLPQDESRRHFDNAYKFLSAGLPDEALIELKNGTRLLEENKDYKNSSYVPFLKGVIYYKEDNDKQALDELKKSLKIEPNFPPSQLFVSMIYLKNEEYDKLEKFIEESNLNSVSWANRYLRAVALYRQKKYPKALEEFNNAKEDLVSGSLDFKGDAPETEFLGKMKTEILASIFLLSAQCNENIGNLGEAKADYKELLKLRPNAEVAVNNLAIIEDRERLKTQPKDAGLMSSLALRYYLKGDLARAQTLYIDAIGLNSDLRMAYNNLGLVYYKKKDFDMAVSSFKKAISKEDKAAAAFACFNMGNVFLDKGDLKKAIMFFNKSLQINSDYGPALEKFEISTKAYEAKKNPKDQMAVRDLGDTYFKYKDYTNAISAYKKALVIRPEPGLIKRLAEAYYMNGDLENASSLLKRLDKANDEYAQFRSGCIYRRMGDLKRAEKGLSAIPKESSYFIRARDELAYVYFAKGDLGKSVSIWSDLSRSKNIEKINPNISEILAILGR